MQKYNLILSGGGVRSYSHLGVYKLLYENNIQIDEIVSVSGGSLVAPFIYLKKSPKEVIEIFKRAKLHKLLFPFWFVPNKFEFLFYQPSTLKLGEWLENQFSISELNQIKSSEKLHIMATKNPLCGIKAMYPNMLKITDLKNAVAASCAISGVFKEVKVDSCTYLDGGHWNNCPIFFEFKDSFVPVIAVSLGYVGLKEKEGGRISKIIRGFEINSYARVQEDIKRWDFEKTCGKRGELFVIEPPVWNVNSLDFDLKEWQIEDMVEIGYRAAKEGLKEARKQGSNTKHDKYSNTFK